MKKRVVILILTLVFLAGARAAAGLPLESRAAAATSKPTETPAVTPGSLPEISPAPEETEPLAGIGGILERLAQDYDPASGAVGAYRWAESVLGQYLADGRDTASARAAGAAYAARYGENDAALKTRLETVRTAAEALTPGRSSVLCATGGFSPPGGRAGKWTRSSPPLPQERPLHNFPAAQPGAVSLLLLRAGRIDISKNNNH